MAKTILSQTQLDAFTEVINIAVGKAAETLSLMIDKKVTIQTPWIELLVKSTLVDRFTARFGSEAVGVSIAYRGLAEGISTLFFEAKDGKTLVDQLLSENEDDDWDDDWGSDKSEAELGFTDSDKEALIEVANLMINGLLGSVGNLLGGQLKYQPPVLKMHFNFIEEFGNMDQGQAFLIESVYLEATKQIRGVLTMHFDLGDFMNVFVKKLDQITPSATEDDEDPF